VGPRGRAGAAPVRRDGAAPKGRPARRLWREGLAMVEVPQTNERLGPATRAFYDAVLDRRIAHDGDPTLAAHLRNVVAVPLGDHGWRLRKVTRNSPRKSTARSPRSWLCSRRCSPPHLRESARSWRDVAHTMAK
jgi:hypothetical protein